MAAHFLGVPRPRQTLAAGRLGRSMGLALGLLGALQSLALAAAPTTAPTVPALPLVSASEDGLWELSAAGKRLRQLSPTPASFARFVSPAAGAGAIQLVFLTDNKSVAEIRVLDLQTKKERLVAKIPPSFPAKLFYEGLSHKPIELRLQSSPDFVADAQSACLMLQDRNTNMASEKARLDVTLATGKFTLTPLLCGRDQEKPTSQCQRAMAETAPHAMGFCRQEYFVHDPPAGPAKNYGYRIKDGEEQQRQPDKSWKTQRQVASLSPEERSSSRSPSGRFQLLAGFSEQGDYLYRRLVVFDAQTGVILNLDDGAVKPLPAKDIVSPVGRLISGEDEVRWFAAPDRVLVAGTLYSIMERTAAEVGTLAR